jgi:flavodoxin
MSFGEARVMSSILVVCYSRSGFTQTVAGELAKACGADLDIIREDANRAGISGYLRSMLEAALHLHPRIHPAGLAPADYDLVVIGTPIWFWNMASPVRTYLETHRTEFRNVAFFCTFGGSGDRKVLQDLERLTGKHPLTRLALMDEEITGRRYHGPLTKFTKRLRGALRFLNRSPHPAAAASH